MILVHRKSGLLEPFDVPDLTIEAAIERSWHLADGGLMMADGPVYLPTVPVDRPWSFYCPPIPWADQAVYDFIAGLTF